MAVRTLTAPVLVDAATLARIEAVSPLAPLHNPPAVAVLRALAARFPGLPQVACFDTAFHRGHPAVADRFAIPDAFYQEGVRRYGFHGLSYEYIAGALARHYPGVAAGRVVVAHLGSGASMCALANGHSVDSSMGFTALDGLPMGTRSGSLDAGVILWLQQQKGWNVDRVEHFLYEECGLKGLSGVSNDMRTLLASEAPLAQLAVDYFVYHVARTAGALAASMGGIDALVFTAGIGERSPEIRARVLRRLAWLGFVLDEAANQAGRPVPDDRGIGTARLCHPDRRGDRHCPPHAGADRRAVNGIGNPVVGTWVRVYNCERSVARWHERRQRHRYRGGLPTARRDSCA